MGKKPVILLLDDETDYRELCSVVLEQVGCKCLHATNDQEALNLLNKHHVDLLIQDVARPNSSGVEFYVVLKADKKLRHVPVLFCTGYPRSELATIQEDTRVFGDDYFGKQNFDLDNFLAKIKEMLVRHKKPLPASLNLALSKV